MGYSNDGSVKIDVSLNMDQVDRDFDQLVKLAKESARSVVKVSADIADAIEETGISTRQTGQEIGKASEKIEESLESAKESTEDFKEETKSLGTESEKTSREQENLGEKTEQTRQVIEKSRESFLNWRDVAKTAVKGTTIAAGILFTAMGAMAGAATSFGAEYQKASNHIQASTGVTKEEMEGLKNVMADVYADNFGEDMNDVADAVANVKRNIGGTDEVIRDAAEAALGFRDAFGYEVQESTRAAKALMDNFGISAKDAYDLMAKGAQNGLDYSGELIDNINEYSVQFGKAGLSAEDMFNIMQSGAESGAWNLDKIGDAVKELNIRLVDGSDTTAAGLEAIGMNADEVAKKMSNGGETARKTYQKVIKSLAEMDDKQAQNIAGVNLFGTMWEDLGPEVISHLADVDGAYSKAKGTMEEINKVQYDDAGAALETLKRKAETSLLLPLSEKIMPAVSEATNAAIGYMEQLASAYETKGVNGLVEKAGEIFADIATNAAEKAPEMANVAVDFIEQMVSGFKKNSQRLTKAGADMVKTIAGAAVKMLPKELQEPVKEAVDDLVDSLTEGGMKNGLKTFGRMFENGFKTVTKVTKTVLPPFVKIVDKTADHLDVLIPLVVAGATAFKTYSIVSSVTDNMKKLSTVTATLAAMEKANALQIAASTGALTAKEMAVGVLTGKVTLATAAQAAWNAVMIANPAVLLTTGVVALGAAIAAYCLISEDGTEKTGELSEAEQKLKDRIDEQYESYQKLREERERQFSKINTEFSNTQALAEELQTIVDKNGKIKKGYEDRAAVIVGILNDALGTEIEITDGVIQKYDELKQSIDQVILSKKAEAVQSAMQDAYADAINNQTEAYMNYAQAQKDVEKTTKELKAAQEKQKEIQDKIDTSTSRAAFAEYGRELQNAKADVEALENKQKDQQKTLSESEETYINYISTIQNYEGVVGAVASGEADKINEALLRATNSFITAETGTKESLERQVSNMTDNYNSLKKAVESGAPGVTQQMVDEAALMVAEATAELSKLSPEASKEFAKLDPAIMETLAKAGLEGKLSDEGKKALKGFVGSLDSLDSDTREKFEMAVEGALKGLDGFDEIKTKAEEEGTSFLEALASTLEVHSPSRAVKKIFSQVNPGAVEGLDEGKDSLLEKGGSLVKDLLETMAGTNTKNAGSEAGKSLVMSVKDGMQLIDAKPTGTSFGNQYSYGIISTKKRNNIAARGVALAARATMETISALATGTGFGAKYAIGITSQQGNSRTAGSKIAIAARTAMASISAMIPGINMGEQYSTGIQSKHSESQNAGKQLAINAKSGTESVSAKGAGQGFGQGFINGIGDMIGGAARAAASLATNALASAKKALDSHSPSKKTDKIGQDFDQGFINAIVRKTSNAVTAAGNMGKKAVQELRKQMEPVTMKFDVESTVRNAEMLVNARIASYAEPRYQKEPKTSQNRQKKEGNVNQTINIYGDTKSPVQISRALRKEGRRLAFQE